MTRCIESSVIGIPVTVAGRRGERSAGDPNWEAVADDYQQREIDLAYLGESLHEQVSFIVFISWLSLHPRGAPATFELMIR
jgi:hypothetical protein